jgi:CDP-paratose 2-epimerase
MKILITGVCGFVGSSLARSFMNGNSALEIFGIDNLSRRAELNRPLLKRKGFIFCTVTSGQKLWNSFRRRWIDAAANRAF